MNDKVKQAETISINIRRLRDLKGWNQSRLAQEANISGAALSKIEKGDGRVPTIVLLRKLASALKVQLHEITGEEASEISNTNEHTYAFYRRWDVLDDLSEEDQARLKDMAERLKEFSPPKK